MALGGGSGKTLTITTKFDADASGYFKEVEKVKAKAKEAGDSWLGFSKSIGDGVKAGVNALGALNQAFEGAQKIIGFARDAIKGWGEDLRMEAANAGRSIDRLADAAQGLVDDDSLNKFAARAGSGALKLTQQQLETVAAGAVALRSRGFEAKEALDILTEAAVTGRTRGLAPLGIELDESATRFEKATNLMSELEKIIAESGGTASKAADDIDQLAVAWANATDEAKNYAAQALLAMGASTGFNTARQFAADQAQAEFMGKFLNTPAMIQAQNLAMTRTFLGGHLKGRDTIKDLQTIEFDKPLDVGGSDSDRKKAVEEAARRAAQKILDSAIAAVDRNVTDVAGRPIGFSTSGMLGAKAETTMFSEFGVPADESAIGQQALEQNVKRLTDDWHAGVAAQREKREGFLESAFGPIDDFNAYATAFGTLTTATNSAMQAWISGSMSLGTAIKKGIGDALGALASQLAIEALKHGAFAIGSAAFGDFAGAAKHTAAAAAFGLGTVAAATAAKKLGASVAADAAAQKGEASGGGANTTGSATGTSGGSGGSGTTTSEGKSTTVIVYADPFAEGTPGTRRRNAKKALDRAKGGGDWEDS